MRRPSAPALAITVRKNRLDNATFEIFRRFYSYDRTALDARIESTEDAGEWRRERVSFAAAYGNERVLANILIPKNALPPYQVVSLRFPARTRSTSNTATVTCHSRITSISCRGAVARSCIRSTKAPTNDM